MLPELVGHACGREEVPALSASADRPLVHGGHRRARAEPQVGQAGAVGARLDGETADVARKSDLRTFAGFAEAGKTDEPRRETHAHLRIAVQPEAREQA